MVYIHQPFLIQDLPLVSSSLVVMMTIVPNQWEDPGPEEASASRQTPKETALDGTTWATKMSSLTNFLQL